MSANTSTDLIRNLDDLLKLASTLVKSKLLPPSITTPEAAAVIILKGRELGIGPMEAFAGISVIQNKPTVGPQLMLAMVNRTGLLEDMTLRDDGSTCTITTKRTGRKPHTTTFSMADAQAMGLVGKDNWKKQPAVMRQWRCMSANFRVVFPDVIAGMYTPEEMGAEVNDEGEFVEGQTERIPEAVIEREAELTGLPLPAAPEPSNGSAGKPKTDIQSGPHKTAKVTTAKWSAGAAALAVRCPHYQNDKGKPNPWHMLNAAGKLGYAEVTDDNLAEVLNALEDYGNQQEAQANPA